MLQEGFQLICDVKGPSLIMIEKLEHSCEEQKSEAGAHVDQYDTGNPDKHLGAGSM